MRTLIIDNQLTLFIVRDSAQNSYIANRKREIFTCKKWYS